MFHFYRAPAIKLVRVLTCFSFVLDFFLSDLLGQGQLSRIVKFSSYEFPGDVSIKHTHKKRCIGKISAVSSVDR